MKSDSWLTRRIIDESVNKYDISFMRRLVQEGKTDEEILLSLRKKMFLNSQGMRDYIRHEKISALMIKLTSKIHWVFLLPAIKSWITEKESLIRWNENIHSEKILEKARKLKNRLIDPELKRMKFGCANGGNIPEDVMFMIEKAAEELLLQIEQEENDRMRNWRELPGSLNQKKAVENNDHERERGHEEKSGESVMSPPRR